MRISKYIKKFFEKKTKPDYSQILYVESLTDVPKNPGSIIYVVAIGRKKKWAVFRCPNNCGGRVEVNLMRSKSPSWILKIKRKKATLYPSVVVNGCGAHFWLRDSKIIEAKFYYEE